MSVIRVMREEGGKGREATHRLRQGVKNTTELH